MIAPAKKPGAVIARRPTRFVHPISMELAIEGMHCDACVRRVQKAIVGVEGAQAPRVVVGSATVSVDPQREDLVLEAIRKAGYQASRVE
jgi:copper chaperone